MSLPDSSFFRATGALLLSAALCGCSAFGGLETGADLAAMTALPRRSDTQSWSGPASNQVQRDAVPSVTFKNDSSKLDSVEADRIQAAAEWATSHNARVILAAGAATASREYSRQLGQQRGSVVRAELVSRGVAEDRISIISYGEDLPGGSPDRVAFGFINGAGVPKE